MVWKQRHNGLEEVCGGEPYALPVNIASLYAANNVSRAREVLDVVYENVVTAAGWIEAGGGSETYACAWNISSLYVATDVHRAPLVLDVVYDGVGAVVRWFRRRLWERDLRVTCQYREVARCQSRAANAACSGQSVRGGSCDGRMVSTQVAGARLTCVLSIFRESTLPVTCTVPRRCWTHLTFA